MKPDLDQHCHDFCDDIYDGGVGDDGDGDGGDGRDGGNNDGGDEGDNGDDGDGNDGDDDNSDGDDVNDGGDCNGDDLFQRAWLAALVLQKLGQVFDPKSRVSLSTSSSTITKSLSNVS